MTSLLLLVAVFSPLAALKCYNYAVVMHGRMDGTRAPAYEGALPATNGQFGVVREETCDEGAFCAGDANFYELPDGRTVGFAHSSCWDGGNMQPPRCGWERKGSKSWQHEGVEDVYRCTCNNTDFCISPTLLIEQWKMAHGHRLTDACERAYGNEWTSYQRTDGRTDCVKLALADRRCYTFDEFSATCAKEGAVMASIRGANEQKQIEELIRKAKKAGKVGDYDLIMLGARRNGDAEEYVWIDDESPVTYANWHPNDPNYVSDARCILIANHEERFGSWWDHHCECQSVHYKNVGTPCTKPMQRLH